MDVSLDCPCKIPLVQSAMSALPIPLGGDRHNFSVDFNPNTNSSVLIKCKQNPSLHQADSHQANPKQNIMCNGLYNYVNINAAYKMKIH
jgi:hypothetical protein